MKTVENLNGLGEQFRSGVPDPSRTIPQHHAAGSCGEASAHGTGVPMRAQEVADRAGKQPDGSAKTREAKIVTIWTAESRDENGKPVRDPGSVTYSAAIESAATLDTSPDPSDFAERVLREAQGLCTSTGVVEAGCKVVIGTRLKRAGMHWTVRGANAIIAFRCSTLRGRYQA